MTTPTPCMGGFCAERNACPNYQAEDRRQPVERMCKPGQERAHVWLQLTPAEHRQPQEVTP